MKYPKLLFLLLTFILAYIIFSGRGYLPFHDSLISLGYIGTFLSGIFFAYGFSAAPATAIFLILAKGQNIFLAAVIGGLGAFVGDFIIFRYIRSSLDKEIRKLQSRFHFSFRQGRFFKKYIVPVMAGFIIASPLPDEIGVAMLGASRTIKTRVFFVISFLLNTTGIYAILLVGELV